MFEELMKITCFSSDPQKRQEAAELLEKQYGCEVNCTEIAETVRFAHHGRNCIVIAAKIYDDVVIFQNVTIGSNMKYNKRSRQWENIGNPIIGKNVVIADGAKILGPIVVGANSVIGASAIVTKDVPADSIVTGVNQLRPKDPDYDLVFNPDMIEPAAIIEANRQLIAAYEAEINE